MGRTNGYKWTCAACGKGLIALALTPLFLISCNIRQQVSVPDASPAQTSEPGCARPILDDPAAVVALQSNIGQVSVPGSMVNRFVAATRAMQAAADARDTATVQCGAENVLYVLSGRFGRYGPADALTPGILPADRDPLSDPGLAITAMTILPDQTAIEAIGTGIVGSINRWSTPTAGWNELDAAIADGTIAALDSPTMQVIGYALLIQRAGALDEARDAARAGLAVARTTLQTTRDVLASGCASFPEAECRL